MDNTLIDKVRDYAISYCQKNFTDQMLYHNIFHIQQVVNYAHEIASNSDIDDETHEIAIIAAWFHDLGIATQVEGHEEIGCDIANKFLGEHNYPEEKIQRVSEAIMATKIINQPTTMLGFILRDADSLHLGKPDFMVRMIALQEEMGLLKGITMDEKDFAKKTVEFFEGHKFYTDYAISTYQPIKKENLKRIKSLIKKLIGENDGKKKSAKPKDLDRGVQTMFRNAHRTHIQLSAIADNKANIMLSINAIILSIIMSMALPIIQNNPAFVIPVGILVVVALVALIFAILAVRPKITRGRFTEEEVKNHSVNLLFFGNFHDMPQDQFEEGMNFMIRDRDYLYTSMVLDFYFLGKVLAKKYRYLRICYTIFLGGFIAAALSLIIPIVL